MKYVKYETRKRVHRVLVARDVSRLLDKIKEMIKRSSSLELSRSRVYSREVVLSLSYVIKSALFQKLCAKLARRRNDREKWKTVVFRNSQFILIRDVRNPVCR